MLLGAGRDFDPNGLGLIITGVSQPSHGTVELIGGQHPGEGFRIRYTRADLNSLQDDEFTYTITEHADKTDGTSTAKVQISVVELAAVGHGYIAIEGQPLIVSADKGLLEDAVSGGFDITAILIGPRPDGLLNVELDGSFTYTPPEGATSDSFGYTFLTESFNSRRATVNIVIAADASRRANGETYTILEDHRLVALPNGFVEELDAAGRRVGDPLLGVLGLDVRGTGPALEAVLVTKPGNGFFNLNPDGSFDYTPPANVSGQQSFTYAIGPRDSDPQATAIIRVLPVNDPPVATSVTGFIPSKSTTLTITVEGSDEETPPKILILTIFTQPELGSVAQSGPLEFIYTPPKGGLNKETDFTFVLRDDGRGGPGFGYSQPTTITISPLVAVAGSFATVSLKGSFGYVGDAAVVLDVDGDRIAGTVLVDGELVDEPTATTAADGSFVLIVPDLLDRNSNGQLDANEGRLVLRGGTIWAIGQAAPLPLIAPANATAISPLTTLVDEFGMTWESAQSEMLSSFGLIEFDVLHDVVIDQVLAGDSTAPQKYRTGLQVLDTASLIANFFAEQTGRDLESVGQSVFTALAAHLRLTGDVVRLSDPATVRAIVNLTALRLRVDVDEQLAAALAQLVSQSNRQLEFIAPVAGESFLAATARVEQVANSSTLADVRSAVAGDITADQLILLHTLQALQDQIDQAVIGNVRPPEILIPDVRISPDEGDPTLVQFVVSLDRESTVPVSMSFQSIDGTLSSAAGDYTPVAGSLEFLPGETQQTIVVPVSVAGLLKGGTLMIQLSGASAAVLEDSFATARILPSGGDDGDAVAAQVELLAPNDGDGNNDGVLDLRQGHVVSLPVLATAEFLTIETESGALFSAASTSETVDSTPPAGQFPADVMPLAGQIDFEITTQSDQLIATLHFEIGLPINTWYHFGPTADNPQSHWYEFLYDGSTGAELFDANEDGLVERVELHLVDGQRGDADLLPNGVIEVQAAPATVSDEVTCSVLPADLTCNGFVDFQDLTLLLANWNKNVSAAKGNLVEADTTPVNFEDLTVLLAAWTGPGAANSPQAAAAHATTGPLNATKQPTESKSSRAATSDHFHGLGRRHDVTLRRAGVTVHRSGNNDGGVCFEKWAVTALVK